MGKIVIKKKPNTFAAVSTKTTAVPKSFLKYKVEVTTWKLFQML